MSLPLSINQEQLDYIKSNYQTPVYVYSEKLIREYAQQFLDFPHNYWLTTRFAMKANSNKTILRLFNKYGFQIEASSEYEAKRAMLAGIPAQDIQLSGQEFPSDVSLLQSDIFFVATSAHQIKQYSQLSNKKEIWIRINVGIGSADFAKINTGWSSSSFGIWYQQLDQIKDLAASFWLKIVKIHSHIWSENGVESWSKATRKVLEIAEQFPEVTTINMWWWFKMAIMDYEKTADLIEIGNAIKSDFENFYTITGRKLHLEVEPGKYLMINTCCLLATIQDIVDTWESGYTFLKLNSGMTEMPRVTLYWIQEPITIVTSQQQQKEYVMVGHCCESWDLITCKLYQPEIIEPRKLPKAEIGDLVLISGVGAYNSSMAIKNYNSFPEAGELLIRENGQILEIRKRQKLEQIMENEVDIDV